MLALLGHGLGGEPVPDLLLHLRERPGRKLAPVFDGADRQELLRQIAFEEPKTPRRHNKSIPAELETIVLKALEKNPADRYATAQELADDLERFVKDEPIRARRPSVVQRARKWSRRHQAVVELD